MSPNSLKKCRPDQHANAASGQFESVFNEPLGQAERRIGDYPFGSFVVEKEIALGAIPIVKYVAGPHIVKEFTERSRHVALTAGRIPNFSNFEVLSTKNMFAKCPRSPWWRREKVEAIVSLVALLHDGMGGVLAHPNLASNIRASGHV